MKKQKGITLIALIITIVVMVILVAVTLIIALGENGIIANTKNAQDEHVAAAFKECVEIAASGHYEPRYEWYDGMEFKGGKYDWMAIQEEIKREYPETIFTFNLSSLPTGATSAEVRNILLVEAEIYCRQAVVDYIDSKKLSGKMTTQQKQGIQNALDAAKQKFVDDFANGIITVEDITTGLGTTMYAGTIESAAKLVIALYGPMSSMVAEYKGTSVPIGFVNTNMYDYYVVMKKSEAEALFEFTDIVEEDGMRRTTIKNYKGNSKNVKVPATLIEDDGSTISVIGIEPYAFVKMYMKVPLINLITGRDTDDTDYDEVLYNNTATLADFKAEIGMSELEYDCGHQEGEQCTKLDCKNEIIRLIVNSTSAEDMENAGIVLGDDPLSDCIATESDGVLYGYFRIGDYAVPVKPTDFIESNIKTILVSEGIQSIGDYAFANSTKLQEIYLPSSIEDIGEDIFAMCNSLTTLKTMNEDVAQSTKKWGCPNELEITYIEPVFEM